MATKRRQPVTLDELLRKALDLILLKLVPGREKDLLDAKTVIIRHRDRLDRPYLERWAQKLSDEAEDSRIGQTLQRLLREADASS